MVQRHPFDQSVYMCVLCAETGGAGRRCRDCLQAGGPVRKTCLPAAEAARRFYVLYLPPLPVLPVFSVSAALSFLPGRIFLYHFSLTGGASSWPRIARTSMM